MNIFEPYVPTQKELRKNVLGQGVKILHALIEHYESGNIENDSVNEVFMGLMTLVCEGRVKGSYTENGKVKWTLSEQSEKREDNVIPFPLSRGFD